MRYIAGSTVPIKPDDVHAYIDHVQFWLRYPVQRQELARIRKLCGHLHVTNGPSRFDRKYVQRLQLKQPATEALRWAASRSDALINLVELTLDLIFATSREADHALQFLQYSVVRRWHGRNQKIKVVGDTRYDASRSARNATVLYPERHSRFAGELNCVHLEWRARSARAVRGIGVHSFGNLLTFDHRKFWDARLLLYSANPERVGRYFRNLHENGRSRSARELDRRKGQVVLNSVNCIQELIDNFRSIRIQRVLIRLDASSLLPGSTHAFCNIPG